MRSGYFCEAPQLSTREALVKLVGKKFDLTFLTRNRVEDSIAYPHFYWASHCYGFCKIDESIHDTWERAGVADAIDFLATEFIRGTNCANEIVI